MSIGLTEIRILKREPRLDKPKPADSLPKRIQGIEKSYWCAVRFSFIVDS